MFSSHASQKARRQRSRHLQEIRRAGLRSCPRRKLTLQAVFLVFLVLAMPLLSAGGRFTDTTYGNDGFGGGPLAIDSPEFSLDMLAMTEDGFLIKSSGQTSAVDRSNLADITNYIVEAGDSLSGIAHQFGVSMDTIVWENGITNPHNLKVGSALQILPVSGITHTVSGQDTLASVAKKYGLTVERLAQQNRLEDDALLIAGARVIIPGGRRTISTTGLIASATAGTYAAYTPPTTVDGAVIIANAATGKLGKWMIKPTGGQYTTYFGARRGHWAVDIADRSAPPILAAANGTVVQSQCGWNGGYGCMILIDHGDGIQTLYGHMRQLSVSVGAAVQQGQQIGLMGATGRVYGRTGIHLHFEVIDNGRKKNPLAYFN